MQDSGDLHRFVASMPNRYAVVFDWLAIGQHAQIVAQRGQRHANVGTFTSLNRRGIAICVVAPDRPGLLAMISAAFASYDLDVIEAEVFTRHASPSLNEALDLFWVTRRPPMQQHGLTHVDIARLRDTLIGLLTNEQSAPVARTSAFIRMPSASSTNIRLLDDADGCFAVLEIETYDRSGLLLAICQALLSEDVQIVGSLIRSHEGRVHGRFDIVELDDGPIVPERRQVIQMAVLSAIDDSPRIIAASNA